MESFDPSTLPLPAGLIEQDKAIASGKNIDELEDPEFPEDHLSVIFTQKRTNEVLQVSKKSMTPMWLTKKLYHKL